MDFRPKPTPSGWESKTVPLALRGSGTPVAGIGKACEAMQSCHSLVAVGETLDYKLVDKFARGFTFRMQRQAAF